jgi:methyl-accepting chemotaxis protein
VADEVRKLAERTNKATGEISDMISDIQSRSKQAVSTMDNSVAELERGAELAQQAGQVITEIQAANASVSQVFADIDLAVREQSSVSQEIAQRVEHVANASESSSTHAANSANEAANIERLTQEMRQAIEKFRI